MEPLKRLYQNPSAALRGPQQSVARMAADVVPDDSHQAHRSSEFLSIARVPIGRRDCCVRVQAEEPFLLMVIMRMFGSEAEHPVARRIDFANDGAPTH